VTAQILTSMVFLKSSRRDKACSSVEDHMLLRTKSEIDWLPLHSGAAPLFFFVYSEWVFHFLDSLSLECWVPDYLVARNSDRLSNGLRLLTKRSPVSASNDIMTAKLVKTN
jgi:hypothetical protein